MKLPDFDMQKAKWDRFKQFHINRCGNTYNDYRTKFVQFVSGELIVDSSDFKPHERKTYSEFGISVLKPNDPGFPAVTYPDGRKVVRSWLENGGWPTFVIDHDEGYVVQVAHPGASKPGIPSWLHVARVYWPGPGRPPVSSNDIIVTEVIPVPREDRIRLNTIIDACKAWEVLDYAEFGIRRTFPAGPINMPAGLSLQFATMTPEQRHQCARNGFQTHVQIHRVPHLLVA